ncbi:MAG: DNA polymerase III subunit delta [Clostridia bacterium]|nr:DNA polymerase III subunit delta [Clostridia bacterium]
MKSILSDIKNQTYSPVYLLFGEEDYLRRQYRDKLRKALSAEGDTMNYTYFEGNNLNTKAVIDLAETMPFMAEYRLIIIENSGLFKTSDDTLADYMKQIPDTTKFVFVEKEIDKRGRLYKAIAAAGRVVEMVHQEDETLKRWIAKTLDQDGKRIQEHTLDYFLQKTGSDMSNIATELEKLICYMGDEEIVSRDDVDAICTNVITNQIFDMIDCMAEQKQKQALDYYKDLLALKEPPMRILYLIARQFNLLLQVKELKAAGHGNDTISQKTGIRKYFLGKYMAQSAKFKRRMLKEALTQCVMAEEQVKTGRLNDIVSVEMLIIRYSSKEFVKN